MFLMTVVMSIVMPSVVMLNVVMRGVVAPPKRAVIGGRINDP
jgi:hypothetical protein